MSAIRDDESGGGGGTTAGTATGAGGAGQGGGTAAGTGTGTAATAARRWAALGLLVSAQFVVMLDTSIVNVALPSIQADLGLRPTAITWVVNAYVLAFGGLLLLAGTVLGISGGGSNTELHRSTDGGVTWSAVVITSGGWTGLAYSSDVVITPEGVQDGWWRKEGHNLAIEDLDKLGVGTGTAPPPPPEEEEDDGDQ